MVWCFEKAKDPLVPSRSSEVSGIFDTFLKKVKSMKKKEEKAQSINEIAPSPRCQSFLGKILILSQ